MVQKLLVSDEQERPDVTDILRMEACHTRILKCGIDIDILQNEFAHTALHGFKPLDILNADNDFKAAKTPGNHSLCIRVCARVSLCVCTCMRVCGRGVLSRTITLLCVHVTEVTLEGFLGQIVTRFVGAVGENMSKLYDACEDAQNDDELKVSPLPPSDCLLACTQPLSESMVYHIHHPHLGIFRGRRRSAIVTGRTSKTFKTAAASFC